jgi:hypothetical protein
VYIYIYGLRWVHGGNVEMQRSWVLILVIGHFFFPAFGENAQLIVVERDVL